MITYWIYTKDGRKVGEFTFSEAALAAGLALMGEEKFIAARFQVACLGLGLNPTAHNKCVAAA